MAHYNNRTRGTTLRRALFILFFFLLTIVSAVTDIPPVDIKSAHADITGGQISLDLRDVDLRDALSALAVKMGVNIIVLENEPVRINFKVQNIAPLDAMELIIQEQGLTYLRNANIIVVGTESQLQQDFFNQMILARFNLYYITADRFQTLVGQLGISQPTLTVDTNQNAVWVQGTAQTLQKVRELVNAVDCPDNRLSLSHKTVTLRFVTPARAVELLVGAGIEPKRYLLLDNRLIVFDAELLNRWHEIEAFFQQLDIPAAIEQVSFVYQLNNIVAGDAADRLAQLGFGSEVKSVVFNNDRFGKEIMISCPPYLETQVRTALVKLDTSRSKVKVPLVTETGDGAHARLNSIRRLLSELSGVNLSNLHISSNLGDSSNPVYVLWVEETPDKVQLVKDLIGEMGSISGGSGGESD